MLQSQSEAVLTYRIEVADANAHLFRVTLSIPQPAREVRVSLPVWIPGSYLVREFARHLSGMHATQSSRDVPIEQIDKASWIARPTGAANLTISYHVYAFDTSVRTAYLDARRGFFNGTSLALRVEGREGESHRVVLRDLPAHWQVATAMRPVDVDAAGRGAYEAADYDELVDHPVELGRFWRGRFDAGGAAHEFVVAGAWPDFDGERLIGDAKKICEAAVTFWNGRKKAPFARYVFMLNAVDEGQGGLEHRASTALIAARRDLPRRGEPHGAEASDGYVGVLGLISHEYFHTWNVKRLRPVEFTRYDYTTENYSKLLWFFEGFTSYYDDLLLLRAGLIDAPRYLKLVAKTIGNVLAAPGRQLQSVAQASFDAWIKYYRSDENTPNATISYYAKGSLVALALDLTLRREGKDGLDAVMRWLWQQSGGGPIGEADIAEALLSVGGRSYDAELASWVHGTDDLPLQPLLAGAGVDWTAQAPTFAQRLGLRVSEGAFSGVRVTHVLRGGAAERAGLAAGDELIAAAGWRLRRLDDALRLLAADSDTPVIVSRDQQLLTLGLRLPPADAAPGGLMLGLQAKPGKAALALRHGWLEA